MPNYLGADWVSWHSTTWKTWLARLIDQPHVRGLEVGTFEGRSAIWWLEHILTGPGSSLHCIDLWQDVEDRYQRALANLQPYGSRVLVERGDSHQLLAIAAAEGNHYEYAYVDGDHRASGCLRDLCDVWPLLQPGGVLIVDDYRWTSRTCRIPPAIAVDAWLHCYADQIQGYELSGCGQAAIWKPAA